MSMCEQIGQIARDNWDTPMSFGTLAEILGLPSAWHAGQQVGRAWRYFDKRGDTATCAAISRVFWREDQL